MSFVEDLFASVDPVLDSVFGDQVTYRSGGQQIAWMATLEAHNIEADPAQDVFDSWHGHTWSGLRAELTLGDGTIVTPAAGDEIALVNSEGTQIYRVLPGPKKRVYEPVSADPEERRILIYTKFRKTE